MSPETAAPDDLAEFEHPLTTRIRTFLRIELLDRQARFHADDASDLSARAGLSSLLDILNLCRRGDLRMEVMKELALQSETLNSYIREPDVDRERLEENLAAIKQMQARIGGSGAAFPNLLKESPFLFNINHRNSIPGGTCTFDLPDYGYWLKLPYADRDRQYRAWLANFAPLTDAVGHILWLIRQTSRPEERTVEAGFYQENIKPGGRPRLIRVLVPMALGVYPEISAGKQRFTLRFVRWSGTDVRPAQVQKPVKFLFALC